MSSALPRLLVLITLIALSGCVTKFKSSDSPDQFYSTSTAITSLTYQIRSTPVFTAKADLKSIDKSLKNSKLFTSTERYYDELPPRKGIYINIEAIYNPPTVPALVFGYLSVSTLTFLPAWSNHDGHKTTYSIYNNGELVKTFEYDRERFIALWLPILPFAWIDLFTDGSYESFASMTNQFLTDAAPLIAKLAKQPSL